MENLPEEIEKYILSFLWKCECGNYLPFPDRMVKFKVQIYHNKIFKCVTYCTGLKCCDTCYHTDLEDKVFRYKLENNYI